MIIWLHVCLTLALILAIPMISAIHNPEWRFYASHNPVSAMAWAIVYLIDFIKVEK